VKDRYYFGRSLTREVDYFAFPRTGSDFFGYCTEGLFDLVSHAHADLDHAEAIDRQREIEPAVLYALGLREDGAAFCPVQFNTLTFGRHASPVSGEHPVVILIRHPIDTAYSLHRVSEARWQRGREIGDLSRWIEGQLAEYEAFYRRAFEVLEGKGTQGLLVRFEELVASAAPLERLVSMLGVTPKLSPKFVHWMLRFERFARPDVERSFYRGGHDRRWMEDEAWRRALEEVEAVPAFGYDVTADAAS